MKTEFDWNDGKYVPDSPCYCLCEMEGVPYTKYMTLKWDGENWWMWNWFDNKTMGWYGLLSHAKVKRWCEIEEEDYESCD